MNIIGTIKIVFLSVIMLVVLTLLTVDKPQKMAKGEIKLGNLPKVVELIGYDDQTFNTNTIIKKDTIIYVGNYESIVLANDLEKMLNLPTGKFIIVSNISDAPWFMKRWQTHTKNEKLKGNKHIPWIYDKDGKIRNYLKVPTADSLKYFVYKVSNKGIINRIYIGKVKAGTIDGGMNDQQKKENLSEVVKIIKGTT